jgi:hypothetical protein
MAGIALSCNRYENTLGVEPMAFILTFSLTFSLSLHFLACMACFTLAASGTKHRGVC